MDKNELLAEAIREYPIGTSFYSLYNKVKYVRNIIDGEYEFYRNTNDITADNNFVYYKGKWAEIIKKSTKIYQIY